MTTRTSKYNSGEYITTVTLVNQERYDSGPFEFDDKLVSFVSKVAVILESIPMEFRNSAEIEIDSHSGYEGSSYASIKIEYARPASAEEKAACDAQIEDRRAWERDRELAQLNALKAKYGQ